MAAILDHQEVGPRRPFLQRALDRLAPSKLMVPGFLLAWSLLVIVPLVVIVLFSFLQVRQFRVVYEPTLATWLSLIDSGRWMAVVRTLRIAITLTILEFLLAFPFALWLAKGCRSKTFKAAVITLLTIPFFLDAASRIIVWRSILGTNGAINTALVWLGVVDQPVEWLLYSEFAVHFGLLGTHFPTMVFPIFMSIALIDDDFIQASSDLGGSPAQTLFNVIVPLALPGIVAGVVFTLVPLMAAFVEPQLLGGGFVDLLGNSVNSALQQLKYPTAAALSTLVILLLGICLAALILVARRRTDIAAMFVAMRR
ncbi:ABC transporter permease [Ancylobacter defluvii]|uniref:ABC transporter permease n=1 Tax=Ancylobacter defluvii TaxID=1282440 RepID=A0A9W6ND01_9HYPH|nr:ABC transporter permease [Ancylobacter defluvii]MBS7586896.1 ABC transporter permease [Ancylobacter defluvii]GLK86202.1 ABC transporter permease [Ancylobacter defluvii]